MRPFAALLLTLAAAVAGCGRAPSDLREWKAEDHDRSDEGENRAAPPRPASAAPPSASAPAQADATATLADITWKTQCAACHGLSGRGDGPQGLMVHAPDLTRADWQAKTSDQEIAHLITTGKDRMPRFDFPPEVLSALVTRI